MGEPYPSQAEIGGVRPAAGLGDTDRHNGVARNHARQPLFGDRGGRVLQQDGAQQRDPDLDGADVEVAIGQFLGDNSCRHAAGAEPAVLLRQVDAEQAEPAHLAHEVAVQDPDLLALDVVRQQPLAGKAPGHLLQCALVLVWNHGRPFTDGWRVWSG